MAPVVAAIGGWLGSKAFGDKEVIGTGASNAATEKARKEAEQKSLLETQEEEKKSASRRALLSTPTSGFGPNKNLARSFLTSL